MKTNTSPGGVLAIAAQASKSAVSHPGTVRKPARHHVEPVNKPRACLKTPERGCVVPDQPQQSRSFGALGCSPPCCGWSSTRPRSFFRQAFRNRRPPLVGLATLVALLGAGLPAPAAFHLWHVKEVFSNADGSVQFIELFNSSSGESLVGGQTLRAYSDGVIKDFVIPGNLPGSPSTANTHFLVATPGFDSLPGGVAPDFTLPDPGVSGPFFNPNATNITITFVGSGDSLMFSGALLPKDGFNSLTDVNASGIPPGTPNIQVTSNTPTRFPNVAGQIDLRTPTPVLTIEAVPPAFVRLLWPTNPPGFDLECNTNLLTTNWVDASPPPIIEGTNHVVTNAVTEAEKFYRLHKP